MRGTADTEILPVCREAEIARTAALARTIWREHYLPIIGERQVEYMLETVQSPAAIAGQIREGSNYFLMLSDGIDAGYFALVRKADAVMLSKLYVERAHRHSGMGIEAVAFAESYCRAHGAATLWLTVNKNNASAVAWYERRGFVIAGPLVQDIGQGYVMDDYRMEKVISSEKR